MQKENRIPFSQAAGFKKAVGTSLLSLTHSLNVSLHSAEFFL